MDWNIPTEIEEVLETLHHHGFEGYIVGGAVRDTLLGRPVSDYDVTTNARPEQVKSLFEKTIDTGLQHGTVTVRLNGRSIEVTTYRVDGKYADHRRPEAVSFSASLRDDAARRDFTINAMAYSPQGGIRDFFGGQADLTARVVRTVGDADQRFSEDALRMLRAVRFACQLGFTIHPQTIASVNQNVSLMRYISGERIKQELDKALVSDHPDALMTIPALIQEVLPQLYICFQTPQNSPHHAYTVGVHTFKSIQAICPDPVLRWTMLLHDLGKPFARTTDPSGRDHFKGHPLMSAVIAGHIMNRLHFSNADRKRILTLIQYHDEYLVADRIRIKQWLRCLGSRELFLDLWAVQYADAAAQAPDTIPQKHAVLQQVADIFHDIERNGEPYLIRHLAVNGSDLLAAGVKQTAIGNTLNRLLDTVIRRPNDNIGDILLQEVKNNV